MPLAVDLDTYAAQAEEFVGAMDREYYRHFAGHKPEFEIQPIYARHAALFTRAVVDELRERLAAAAHGDEARRVRYLLELAVGGLLGNETKEEETALAEREAALEIEVGGERMPYRQSAVEQGNEPDAGRRAEIERARLDVLERELNPLHRRALERSLTTCLVILAGSGLLLRSVGSASCSLRRIADRVPWPHCVRSAE